MLIRVAVVIASASPPNTAIAATAATSA